MEPQFFTFKPSARLQAFISHYWLGLNSVGTYYPIIPDGSVDVVVRLAGDTLESKVFGTTTYRTDIPVVPNNHYLGIRFKPGQSRHFINAAARELTDGEESAQGLLNVSLSRLHEHLTPQHIGAYLDQIIEGHLAKLQPEKGRIDHVIQLIQQHHGQLTVAAAADVFCKSRRQFERVFLETVGIPPKLYASIHRFQFACQLIHPASGLPLAQAATAAGYTDQSHMNRDFKRLTGIPPSQFIAGHVAFVQYPG